MAWAHEERALAINSKLFRLFIDANFIPATPPAARRAAVPRSQSA
jgi:hypothetical protein